MLALYFNSLLVATAATGCEWSSTSLTRITCLIYQLLTAHNFVCMFAQADELSGLAQVIYKACPG